VLLGPRVLAGALAGIVLLVFLRACSGEFSVWDDLYNITGNQFLNPPTWQGLAHFWRQPYVRMYIPLTYSAWWGLAHVGRLDAPDLNGNLLNPWLFHTAVVVLHVVNVLLVFAILRRIVRRQGGPLAAALGALVFGLHPLQVEPVAWATGLKDTLSGALALGALWQYLLFAEAGETGAKSSARRGHYWIATALFVLSMLAKPTAVVLPALAAVLDWLVVRRRPGAVARDLALWALLAIPCVVWTKLAQPAAEFMAPPLWSRPLIALDSLAFYLFKLLWPAQLCIDYGRSPAYVLRHHDLYWTWIVPTALCLGLLAARSRHLLAGAMLFVIPLLPVLGLVTFVFQFYSTVCDRYVYLSMLGVAVAVAWLIDRWPRRSVIAAAGVLVVVLAVRSGLQVRYWEDDTAIFEHVLDVNPGSFLAHNNYGLAITHDAERLEMLLRKPEAEARLHEALGHFEAAIAGNPNWDKPYDNAARIYAHLGDHARAIEYERHALELGFALPPEFQRSYVPMLNFLGRQYMAAGRYREAVDVFEQAMKPSGGDSGASDAREGLAEAQAKLERSASTTQANE